MATDPRAMSIETLPFLREENSVALRNGRIIGQSPPFLLKSGRSLPVRLEAADTKREATLLDIHSVKKRRSRDLICLRVSG
jgi:hypothetical protein